MRILSTTLLLIFAATSHSQSVKLPAEVKGTKGAFVVVRAETDCAGLKWLVLDPGLSLIPPDLLKDSKVAIVQAGADGRYRILAYGAKGDNASEPVVCTVVIGDAGPTPPGPGPGPGPSPNPEPNDPLFPSLKTAFTSEADPTKKELAKKFAEFYRQAAAQAVRPDLNTWGILFKTLDTVAASEGLKGKLPGVQAILGAEMKQQFPSAAAGNTPIDDAGKKKAESVFNRFVTLLEALN